jgi:hypothetical protein
LPTEKDPTAVEAGVARLAALGCSVEQIALELGVSCADVVEAFRSVSDAPARAREVRAAQQDETAPPR